MFDPIINFFNELWALFIQFIMDILQWVLDVILSFIWVLLYAAKYAIYKCFDFALSLFIPQLAAWFDEFPNLDIWTDNILGYLSTINQLFPVTEFFSCLSALFTFWLGVWVFKTVKAFIPTE